MYKKILAPLDGSKLSECSLEHVKVIAKGCQVPEVVLLTVVEEYKAISPQLETESTLQETIKHLEKEKKEAQMRATEYLNKVARSLKEEGIAAQSAVVMSGKINGVVDAILDFVRDNKIDLIVMSTHGRSGISRWAFGSVADKIIRESKIPVLTLSPTGCRASL